MTGWAKWRIAVAAPVVVMAPLIALAPTADHRFNVYWHGGLFRDRPWAIVPHTLGTVDTYLRLGNFRPLGRILEKSLDLLAYTISDVLGLPANVTLRLVSLLGAIALTVAATLLAEAMVTRPGRPPSHLVVIVPFAAGGGLVAATANSPAVLFGGLYLGSAALVLLVAAAVARVRPDRPAPRWWSTGLLVLGGGLLACVNEIAYLALPLATVAGLVRRPIGRRRVVVLAALWGGFLPVFVAVRVVIHGFCADGGCYRLSDITLGPAVLTTIPVRATAWLPPLMWEAAIRGSRGSWLGVVPVVAALALGLLAWRAIRALPALSPVDRRDAMALAAVAAAAILLGATLAALNGVMQSHRGPWGLGWRDTAVTAAGGAVLLVALGCAAFRRTHAAVLIVIFALVATVGAAANKRFADRFSAAPRAILADRIAQEMAAFDGSPAGDTRRCALRAEFRAEHAESAFSLTRFDQSLDVASRQLAGVPFCSGSSG